MKLRPITLNLIAANQPRGWYNSSMGGECFFLGHQRNLFIDLTSGSEKINFNQLKSNREDDYNSDLPNTVEQINYIHRSSRYRRKLAVLT